MNIKLKTYDNHELFAQFFPVEKAKGTIVFIHGFVEYSAHYVHLSKQVNAYGYNLFKYDLRGHGRSSIALDTVTDMNVMINDLETCINWVKDYDSSLDVFTLGFSLGGLISVLYGLMNPFALSGQILLGPGLALKEDFRNLSDKNYSTADFLKMMGAQRDTGIHDLLRMNSPSVLRSIPAVFLKSVFYEGSKFVWEHTHLYQYPLLILHGKKDPMISYHVSEDFIDAIASSDKELIILEDAYHDMLRTDKAKSIISIIMKWCEEH